MDNTVVSEQDLLAQFPDLLHFKDFQGFTRNTSSFANSKVTGCIFGVDLERRWFAFPYVKIGQWEVHSNPPAILIGRDLQSGFGVVPEPGWEEIVQANSMPKYIVKEIREYLSGRPPIDWLGGE
jgi:hypothetical protein